MGRFALCPTYHYRDGGCREALLGEWIQGSSRCVSTPGKGGLSSTATGGLVRAGGGRRVEWSLPRVLTEAGECAGQRLIQDKGIVKAAWGG